MKTSTRTEKITSGSAVVHSPCDMRNFLRLLLLSALAWPFLAQAAWIEVSSRHFVIYSQYKPEVARALAERLERFDQAVRQANRLADPELAPVNRLTVYMLDGKMTLGPTIDERRTSEYAGDAGEATALVVPRNGATPAVSDGRLFYPYTQHLQETRYPQPWPRWLSEGFAGFHSNAWLREDDTVELGTTPGRRLDFRYSKERLPAVELMSVPTGGSDLGVVNARGWLLVHYLIFDPARVGQLATYLRILETGKSSLEAATEAFGDITKLDRDAENYLQRGNFASTVIKPRVSHPPVTLRELSSGEQAAVAIRIRSKRDNTPSDALELAPAARKTAAMFPAEAVVQATLAKVELDAGNFAAAELAADRVIAIDPQRVDGHLYKGWAQMRSLQSSATRDPERWTRARRSLIAANQLEPDDPRSLILFYRSFIAAGDTPTQNAIDGLYRALELAPQDRTLQMICARQSLLEGKANAARISLLHAAYDVHSATRARRATEILTKLDQDGAQAAIEELSNTPLGW